MVGEERCNGGCDCDCCCLGGGPGLLLLERDGLAVMANLDNVAVALVVLVTTGNEEVEEEVVRTGEKLTVFLGG